MGDPGRDDVGTGHVSDNSAEDFANLAALLSGGPSETLLRALLSNNVNPIIAALRIAASDRYTTGFRAGIEAAAKACEERAEYAKRYAGLEGHQRALALGCAVGTAFWGLVLLAWWLI